LHVVSVLKCCLKAAVIHAVPYSTVENFNYVKYKQNINSLNFSAIVKRIPHSVYGKAVCGP
jgi:hypothetical protein